MNDAARNIMEGQQLLTQAVLNEMHMDMIRYERWKQSRCPGEDASLAAWEAHKREQREYERQREIELYGYALNGWNA